ncbi:MAG: dTDP-glucose 4,6-dehydratase [Promethearchaeota archaeon]
MKTIMVTGGCGFIGSNFIRMILANDKDTSVVNVDKLTYAGNLGNLKEYWSDERLHFYKVDINNKEAIGAILHEHDIRQVVHFAAETHVDRAILNARQFIDANISGTNALIEILMKHDVDRFVQVSTDEVYGSLTDGGNAFNEESPLKPRNPYAATKASADLIVLSYWHTHGFPAIITRSCNIFGPYQFPEKFIPVIISNAMSNESIPIYGDGSYYRDWLHVQDQCEAIIKVLKKGREGEIYNFSANTEKRNIDLAKEILKIMGKPESLLTFVDDRKGHDFRYAMDCKKASSQLGWQPRVSFKEGLEQTVSWYVNHVTWLDEIKSGRYLKYHDDYIKSRAR